MLFVTVLIASNIFETKQIALGPINLTGGILVFPLAYIICNCVCEVWGYQRACLLIWMGFLMNFFFVAFAAVVDVIPGAPYFENQEGFHAIFALAPRITIASCIAFLGVLPGRELLSLLLLQFILKILYEIILLPLTIFFIRKLKVYEGEDVYDRDISYGIFDVFKRG